MVSHCRLHHFFVVVVQNISNYVHSNTCKTTYITHFMLFNKASLGLHVLTHYTVKTTNFSKSAFKMKKKNYITYKLSFILFKGLV